jgi:hypothetical protein
MSRRQEALVAQALRHLAVDHALGEALDDGGLADAGLADQHRVVLGTALQHLDGAADLVVAADDRVELAVAGALREIDGVLLQRLARFLRISAVDTPSPPRTSAIACSSAAAVTPGLQGSRRTSPPASSRAASTVSLET